MQPGADTRAGPAPALRPGMGVRVRNAGHPGHHRTPLYLKGRRGVVERYVENARNPETLAYGRDGTPRVPVYQVRFRQADLWPGYAGASRDTLLVDLLEHWLEPAD
jgi:nitrile hydratase subunit beta